MSTTPEQIPTPRSDRFRNSVIEVFARYNKGEIYIEDVACFVKLAFADGSYIERDLTACKDREARLREVLQRIVQEALGHHEYNRISGKTRLPLGYQNIVTIAESALSSGKLGGGK